MASFAPGVLGIARMFNLCACLVPIRSPIWGVSSNSDSELPMLSKWRWILLQITRQLWVRAALIGALGIVAALLAAIGEFVIPWTLPGEIGAEAVDDILNIIASSMLAVTTFSLSVMTSAFSAATNNVTPRATRLLMQDQVTQNVLATFIGSFLFALVGIVMLKTGIYGDRGRVILFVATVAVITLIVITLIRWIDHLSELGRVGATTNRVEDATKAAIDARLATPLLGGHRRAPHAPPPEGVETVVSAATGYVQHIDLKGLNDCAEALDADIHLAAVPGGFVHPARPLLWVSAGGPLEDGAHDKLRTCFAIGSERSFDQDPRFGLAVMSEIASRAMSPAVNDSGTAIDVIGRLTRLLLRWAEGTNEPADTDDVPFSRLYVPPIETRDLFDDAFNLIARDGAGLIEVQIRLQKALAALAQAGDAEFRRCAREQSRLALERALEAMTSEQDKARIKETAEALG